MKKWKKRKSQIDKLAVISAAVLSINQLTAGSEFVLAQELEYDGTTQMTTEDFTLDVDAFATELIVGEVYVEAGSQVAEGDKILKLTQESYQEALDYYEAAIIRAKNELTDTQREYDQGVLETEYAYEMARMKADQAEFVREYQQEELEGAIADHEEIQTEITERIAELESGSYGSSSTGGSSGSGSGSSSGGSSSGGSSGSSSGGGSSNGEKAEEDSSEIEFGSAADTEQIDGETPDKESDTDAEPETEETEPGTDTETGETTGNTQQQIVELKQQIEAAEETCNTILNELAALLGVTEDSGVSETEISSSGGQNSLQSELQASIDGDTILFGHMKNLQKMSEKIPDSLISAAEAAGINSNDYIKLLNECTVQIESDIAAQKAVQSALAEMEESENTGTGEENKGIDEAEIKELVSRLEEAGRERSSLYGQLIILEEKQQEDYQALAESQEKEIASLQEELKKLSGVQQDGNESEDSVSSDAESGENSMKPSDTASGDSDIQSSDTASGDGTSDKSSASDKSGSSDASGLSGMSGSSGSSGGSASSGAASGGSAGASSGMSGTANNGTGGGSMSMAELNLTEEDISLFGDTYDLSQIESMLEQEPSDSDSAQELIDQLEDSMDTVVEQYEELTRNEKATELKIQYTYDSSVLAGKLAEITYEQELQEWEDTLAEALDTKTALEERKQTLEAMTDGIVTAAQSGTVAAVNYEADDVLSSINPLLSFYDTDVVTVTISVPQEEIALLTVGETVEIVLSGTRSRTGTITQKSLEAQEGTSRTVVNYEVTVSMDNEDGRLTAGTAATVRTGMDEEGLKEDQNE